MIPHTSFTSQILMPKHLCVLCESTDRISLSSMSKDSSTRSTISDDGVGRLSGRLSGRRAT